MKPLLCDFCSDPDPVWAHECQDFEMETDPGPVVLHQRSTGFWAACETCHALITRDAWAALTRRSIKTFRQKHPGAAIPDNVLEGYMTNLHGQFRARRAGRWGRISPLP